jgi:hypothetical protein
LAFYLGNEEFRIEWLLKLQQWFEVKAGENEDALYIRPKKDTYSAAEMLEAVTMLAESRPDECDTEEGWTRLWWD